MGTNLPSVRLAHRYARSKLTNFQGVLVIANYGVLLYTSLGMTKFMPLLLSALWVTSTFPGNVFTSLMIDRLGRRTFMLIGLAGTMVANIRICAGCRSIGSISYTAHGNSYPAQCESCDPGTVEQRCRSPIVTEGGEPLDWHHFQTNAAAHNSTLGALD